MKVTYIAERHADGVELDGQPGPVMTGDTIEVDTTAGKSLLDQDENWSPADDEGEAYLKAKADAAEKADADAAAEASRVATEQARRDRGLSPESTVPQLKAYAAEHDIDIKGATTKPDLIAAITSTEKKEA